MNKPTYARTLRSIRDNGLNYTARRAIDACDIDALSVCDAVANLMRETDWLAMRAQFARGGDRPAVAFRLTTWVTRHA